MQRDALNNVGVFLMDQGKTPQALPYLERLVEGYPAYFSGRVNLADAYLLNRDYVRATEQYRQALALQPGSGRALTGLGDVALAEDHRQEARRFYQEALARGWDQPELHLSLAQLAMRDHQPDEALRQLTRAVNQGLAQPESLITRPEFAPLRYSPLFRRLQEHTQ